MNSKNHKKNTNFKIKNFLVGSCHTADGAYSLLLDLKEERVAALQNYEVGKLKSKAKKLRLEEKLAKATKDYERIEIEARLLELDNVTKMGETMLPATLDELAYINECLAKLEPLRQYKHLSQVEANEACQEEEWKLELIWRAENYILSEGRIPADHFSTMRMHPQFQTQILPAIENLNNLLNSSRLMIENIVPEHKDAALEEKNNAIKLLEDKMSPVNILEIQ